MFRQYEHLEMGQAEVNNEKPIDIFVSFGCSACYELNRFLDSFHIPFSVIIVDNNTRLDANGVLHPILPGVTLLDGSYIEGFSKNWYLNLLKEGKLLAVSEHDNGTH